MKVPLARLDGHDSELETIVLDMKNKVSIHDLYNQLKNKAQVEKVKSLERSIVQLNEHVQSLPQVFADLNENEAAHKLL